MMAEIRGEHDGSYKGKRNFAAAQADMPQLNAVPLFQPQRAAQLRGRRHRLVRDFLGDDRAFWRHMMGDTPAVQHRGRGCGFADLVPQRADLGQGLRRFGLARRGDVGAGDQRQRQSRGRQGM